MLADAGIAYTFLGRELGARSDNPACYQEGKVQFDRLAQEPIFAEGIGRVIQGMQRYRIALLCAEKDPLDCHRALLVARKLSETGITISHIHADGVLESHQALESRLLAACKLPAGDLFTSAKSSSPTPIASVASRSHTRTKPWIKPSSTSRRTPTYETLYHRIHQEERGAVLHSPQATGPCALVDVRLNNTSQLAGFTKKSDLIFFLREICDIDYLHLTELAPTQDILDTYKKNGGDWSVYEKQFLALLAARRVEETVDKNLLAGGCLLCSEATPEQCHRRLVAEYLREKWGDVEIEHL